MDFTLNFLPPGGLSSSVITTVWIGVMVVVFFNLRFGTTLSGLVVPGYLIPLFIVHPVSGFVILIESILTYFIARGVADRGLVRLGLGEMFGRDRFFMLILISVLVRVISDGFLLPQLASLLAQWGAPYEVRSGLHSFGLIIIALCANQLWNGGIKVGGLSLTLYLVVTYVIVVYLLMPYTNFNISTLGYMYEDIASSILASPKAYIILITAAFISSRMNLRYGWDFNGILIPSLLALQWYDPMKILATFAEAVIILLFAQGVMLLPLMRQVNIEGARQLLLFFNVGFVYKLLLGFVVIYWMPQEKVTDFYGFGYVLGTLMALKMYQKGIAIRFTRTTLQTSLVAMVLASILGFSLTLFNSKMPNLAQSELQQANFQSDAEPIESVVARLRGVSYRSEEAQRHSMPLPTQLASFSELFGYVSALTTQPPQNMLSTIAVLSKRVGYEMSFVQQRYVVLHDAQPERGWGIFVFDIKATTKLAVAVPRALDEPKAASVALPVMKALNARYLSYAGARATRSDDGSDDVLLNAQTPMQLFHQAVANNNTLQLRSYTRSAARQLLGIRGNVESLDLQIEQSALYIKRALPADLNLQRLEQLLGRFAVNWHSPKTPNRQRDTAISGFAEVYLNDDSLLNIFTRLLDAQEYQALAKAQRIDGYLQNFLVSGELDFATKHSQDYVPAKTHELLYFDQAILKPTLALVDQVDAHLWQAKHHTQLKQISHAASRFGYEVVLYRHIASNDRYVIFQPMGQNEDNKHWGTYVVKVGSAANYIVEVPRPIYEQNSYEFGAVLFEALDARALLVSGAHPMANIDGTAQLTSLRNSTSLFNLFHQSLLTHYSSKQPFAVQVRGFSPLAEEAADLAYLAHFEYQKPSARHHPGFATLAQTLNSVGLKLHKNQADGLDSRFEAKLNAQSRYTRFIHDAQYAEVWLPTLLRQQFKRQQSDEQLAKKLLAVGLVAHNVDVKPYLAEQDLIATPEAELAQLKASLVGFEHSQNIEHLMDLMQVRQKPQLLVDNNTQQYFLAFFNDQNKLQLVANLLPLNAAQTSGDIERFYDNRQHFLYLGGAL